MPSIRSTFIFEQAPFTAAHASTIAETPAGLVAAFFGGTREGHRDVGIWVARHDGLDWLPPVEVANGHVRLRRSYPCWNPVLFQTPQGPLLLFYKVGPSPSRWWGVLRSSSDSGRTWSEPQRLPDGILGPIKNKPLALPGGRWLCPSSDEKGAWRIHLEWSDDRGESWQRGPAPQRRAPFRGDSARSADLGERPPAAAVPDPPGCHRHLLVGRCRHHLNGTGRKPSAQS